MSTITQLAFFAVVAVLGALPLFIFVCAVMSLMPDAPAYAIAVTKLIW